MKRGRCPGCGEPLSKLVVSVLLVGAGAGLRQDTVCAACGDRALRLFPAGEQSFAATKLAPFANHFRGLAVAYGGDRGEGLRQAADILEEGRIASPIPPPVKPSRPTPAKAAADETELPPAFRRPAKESNGPPPAALSPCERAILNVLAERGRPTSRAYVAIVSGYSVQSGGVNKSLARLRRDGWIVGGDGDLAITDEGRRTAGAVKPLPRGAELLEVWASRLTPCASLLFAKSVDVYPYPVTAEQIEELGYSATSGGVNKAIAVLRALELATPRGPLRASDTFMHALESPPLLRGSTP